MIIFQCWMICMTTRIKKIGWIIYKKYGLIIFDNIIDTNIIINSQSMTMMFFFIAVFYYEEKKLFVERNTKFAYVAAASAFLKYFLI
jgi:hypothetical protein